MGSVRDVCRVPGGGRPGRGARDVVSRVRAARLPGRRVARCARRARSFVHPHHPAVVGRIPRRRNRRVDGRPYGSPHGPGFPARAHRLHLRALRGAARHRRRSLGGNRRDRARAVRRRRARLPGRRAACAADLHVGLDGQPEGHPAFVQGARNQAHGQGGAHVLPRRGVGHGRAAVFRRVAHLLQGAQRRRPAAPVRPRHLPRHAQAGRLHRRARRHVHVPEPRDAFQFQQPLRHAEGRVHGKRAPDGPMQPRRLQTAELLRHV